MAASEPKRQPDREGWADEVATVVDPLLADVWALAWEAAGDGDPDAAARLPLLLRLAYLQGYRDALEEPVRGALYARLGVVIPPAPKRPPAAKARRPRGSQSSSDS